MDEALTTLIEELPRDQALEAARFLAEAMEVVTDDGAVAAVEPLTSSPYEHLEQIEELAKLLLLLSAADSELEGEVRRAIEGAGRKQFIFGGLEIIALAALAVTALHVVVSKGKSEERETVRIETKPDGTTIETSERETKFKISAGLAKVVTRYLRP